MELDKEVVQDILSHLSETVDDLESLKVTSPDELKGNKERYRAIKNALYESIMDVLAISQHLIAALELEKPRSYSDIFRILRENEVFPQALFEKFEKAGGFRVLLAHEYRRLKPEKIFELSLRSADFREFINFVADFLKKA